MQVKHIMEMEIILLTTANFSPETMKGRKQWNEIFRMLRRREGNYQPRNLYSAGYLSKIKVIFLKAILGE